MSQVLAKDLSLGDVVSTFTGERGFDASMVVAIDHERQEVELYRPYIVHHGMSYGSGPGVSKLTPYIGTETYRIHFDREVSRYYKGEVR